MSVPGEPVDGSGDERDRDLPLVDVVVPDDARELDADLRAYLLEQRRRWREERARTSRSRWRRLVYTRRWQRHGLSGPLLVLCLLAVAAVGSLMAVLGPRPSAFPRALPLAVGAGAVGSVGGLLPETTLVGRAGERSVRDLRPAVVGLVRGDCACPERIDGAYSQTREFLVRFVLVTAPEDRLAVRALAVGSGNGAVSVLADRQDELARTYEPEGLTLLFVGADGVVHDVVRDLPAGARIEALVAPLAHTASAR